MGRDKEQCHDDFLVKSCYSHVQAGKGLDGIGMSRNKEENERGVRWRTEWIFVNYDIHETKRAAGHGCGNDRQFPILAWTMAWTRYTGLFWFGMECRQQPCFFCSQDKYQVTGGVGDCFINRYRLAAQKDGKQIHHHKFQ